MRRTKPPRPTGRRADGPTGGGAVLTDGGLLAGRYRLLGVLDEGGMGTVYRAEQVVPVCREVAVKLVKAGMDSRPSSPGSRPSGRPWPSWTTRTSPASLTAARPSTAARSSSWNWSATFPLTDYCDARRLSARDRLGLFAAVCRSVHHDDQKGVIHNDLKPSNVLVAEVDGRAVPKVIDFGLATALRAAVLGNAAVDPAAVGWVLGTPLYMAPEQAEFGEAGGTRGPTCTPWA